MHTTSDRHSLPPVDLREEVPAGIFTHSPRLPAWGAILAGAVAGLATHILLMMALTAIGLGTADPATDANPVATFSVGTALAWSLSALLSLFVGGWVAGRCAARTHQVSGGMHGFLVWCVGTIAAVVLLAAGAGTVISGAAGVVSQGLSAAAKPLAGAADLAKEAVAQNTSAISGMIDEVAENPQVRSAANSAAARREVGQAVKQLFKEGGDLRNPQARDAVIQALGRAGVNPQDATRMVDSWTTSMEQLRAQLAETKAAAATKAREMAEVASDAVAKAALWAFVSFVLGAVAATFGGRRGQTWEDNHTERAAISSSETAQIRNAAVTAVPNEA